MYVAKLCIYSKQNESLLSIAHSVRVGEENMLLISCELRGSLFQEVKRKAPGGDESILACMIGETLQV